MGFGVIAAAKASNDNPLQVGHGADYAPREELVFIGHSIFDQGSEIERFMPRHESWCNLQRQPLA